MPEHRISYTIHQVSAAGRNWPDQASAKKSGPTWRCRLFLAGGSAMNPTSDQPESKQAAARFQPGQSGNPNGRPKGLGAHRNGPTYAHFC